MNDTSTSAEFKTESKVHLSEWHRGSSWVAHLVLFALFASFALPTQNVTAQLRSKQNPSPPRILKSGQAVQGAQGKVTKEEQRKQFDEAFEVLATSGDTKEVNQALVVFGRAGFSAVPFLSTKASDSRVPPVNFSNKQMSGKPTMGQNAFWGVQNVLEPTVIGGMRLTAVPRGYQSYNVLKQDTVQKWVADRRGKSLKAMQVELAEEALASVSADHRRNPTATTQRVLDLFRLRLNVLVTDRVMRTEDEWRARLTPLEFEVTRQAGTERAFSGDYWDNKKKGKYVCKCCGQDLFKSDSKFKSGTGWPSYFQPIARSAVKDVQDLSHGMVRTETRCSRCEAHLGHVFDDGPRPTGLRYCMNSASLKFIPEGSGLEEEMKFSPATQGSGTRAPAPNPGR